jgi:hypothetical protein
MLIRGSGSAELNAGATLILSLQDPNNDKIREFRCGAPSHFYYGGYASSGPLVLIPAKAPTS